MMRSKGVIGSIAPSNKTIHIYGAGISGLIIAYKLKLKGYRVLLHEKENHVGGKLKTIKRQYGLVETGANAIFSSPEVMELLKSLQIDFIYPNENLKKLIFRNEKFRVFPLSFLETFKIFFKLLRKVPDSPNISIYNFFYPLLGRKVCLEVLQCVFNGIYATPIEELHFKSIFKDDYSNMTYLKFFRTLKKQKKGYKGKSISFKNGMQDLINKLQEKLKDEIIFEEQPKLSDATNIICTDAKNAALLLKDYPAISELLTQIEYTHLNSYTLFTNNKIPSLNNAFGVLFPYSESQTLGILNNNAIFEGRSFKENIHSYTFITKANSIKSKIENLQLIEINKNEWQRALPIYNLERFKTIERLRSHIYSVDNLAIFGNYVDGISMREMISHINDFTDNL